MKTRFNIVMPVCGVLAVLSYQGCSSPAGGSAVNPTVVNPTVVSPSVVNPSVVSPTVVSPAVVSPTVVNPTVVNPTVVNPTVVRPTALAASSMPPYFEPAASGVKAPGPDGFLQRWLLLEPIPQSIRSNAVFTESYIRNAIGTEYFPNQFTVVPRDGDKVKIGDEESVWHALDSNCFNVKLFRFAEAMNKPTYSILFWVVTIVDSPREIHDVRMAVGSNSASMWWLNGQEAVSLFGDRRMVMDDCVSKRLTIKKGRNIIRGAVINGPGLSDFCLRFIDEAGEPIKDITLNLDTI